MQKVLAATMNMGSEIKRPEVQRAISLVSDAVDQFGSDAVLQHFADGYRPHPDWLPGVEHLLDYVDSPECAAVHIAGLEGSVRQFVANPASAEWQLEEARLRWMVAAMICLLEVARWWWACSRNECYPSVFLKRQDV